LRPDRMRVNGDVHDVSIPTCRDSGG
jgi:hypothetical protein